MSTIKLVIDSNDSKQLRAALKFFEVLNGGELVAPGPAAPVENETKGPSISEKVKTETVKEKPAKTEKTETVQEEETPSAYTIDIIRELVAAKQGDHRDAIKAKLVELNIKAVRFIEEKDYESFGKFLEGLA